MKLNHRDQELMDNYAGLAMNAMLSNQPISNAERREIVREAWNFAESMMGQREIVIKNMEDSNM